jgi:hypothetical protein
MLGVTLKPQVPATPLGNSGTPTKGDLQPMPVQAMEQIAELRRQACKSADFTEGLAAFTERRSAVFCGQ